MNGSSCGSSCSSEPACLGKPGRRRWYFWVTLHIWLLGGLLCSLLSLPGQKYSLWAPCSDFRCVVLLRRVCWSSMCSQKYSPIHSPSNSGFCFLSSEWTSRFWRADFWFFACSFCKFWHCPQVFREVMPHLSSFGLRSHGLGSSLKDFLVCRLSHRYLKLCLVCWGREKSKLH